MSYIARLALFLCRAAQFWPIASPRAKFQMHALGVAFDSYLQDERTAEAAALVPQYLRLVRTVYGPNPQGRVGAVCMSRQVDFGRILHAAGGTEEGSALVKQCVDWFKQHPPEEDAVWGACLLNLGGVLVHLQQPQEAIEWLEEASQLWRRVHGPDSYEVAQCQNNLGVAYQDLGQLDAAERAQREALRLNELAAEHGRGVAIALNNLSATLNKTGRFEEGQQLSLRAIQLVQNDEELRCDMLDTLAGHYEALGKFDQSITTRANAISLAIGQNKSAKVTEFGAKQAALMDQVGRTEEAAKCRRTMADMRRQAFEEHAAQAAQVDPDS